MKRFKILSTLLLVSFLIAVFQSTVMSFVEGFNLGYGIASFELENHVQSETFTYLDLKPKTDDITPNTHNIKDSTALFLIPTKASVVAFYPETHQKSVAEIAISVVNGLLNLGILVCFVYVLVIFIKIVLSFRRSEVFEDINIKRINIIGIGFLVLGALSSAWQGLSIFMARQAIELTDYTISYANIIDWDDIVMGLIILLMNEVLRLATGYKKEQDLTI
ncbi:MAG TPA: DUF2975 domain-containing protein [Paludibacteraceae bacterium]|mgnify:CR=1 FL=1|nr:DUF2975 domain-containing protein [Paludibacteraceae bacterium]HQB68957.1 DUF2975 domain-containing protein [Paludibacteraceae bacterium]HRS67465.1 DUF2975 domain-containing protein [Paludibacteraceae bacterium]